MPPQPPVQTFDERTAFQVTVFFDPGLDALTRALQLLARRALHDPRRAIMVFEPVQFKTKEGEASFHAQMKSAETDDLSLLRRHFETELPEPLR